MRLVGLQQLRQVGRIPFRLSDRGVRRPPVDADPLDPGTDGALDVLQEHGVSLQTAGCAAVTGTDDDAIHCLGCLRPVHCRVELTDIHKMQFCHVGNLLHLGHDRHQDGRVERISTGDLVGLVTPLAVQLGCPLRRCSCRSHRHRRRCRRCCPVRRGRPSAGISRAGQRTSSLPTPRPPCPEADWPTPVIALATVDFLRRMLASEPPTASRWPTTSPLARIPAS